MGLCLFTFLKGMLVVGCCLSFCRGLVILRLPVQAQVASGPLKKVAAIGLVILAFSEVFYVFISVLSVLLLLKCPTHLHLPTVHLSHL